MPGKVLRILCIGILMCIGGCTTTVGLQSGTPPFQAGQAQQHWQGRLGVKVTEPQPQSFSANFELDGDTSRGSLRLLTPLGTTLALLQWAPGSAVLTTTGEPRTFDSTAALTQALLGFELPIAALLDWLRGTATAVNFWEVDLTDLVNGKLVAKRTAPDMKAELKLLIDTQ
jgi:outer membrane lipoprotein LolB